MRPVQAAQELDVNDPKTAGLKLGAALYQDMQALRFLGDTAAVGRYETMLKFVCDKNGVTRADVERFYRQGIKDLVAETVREQFNQIDFGLYNYNTTLTRDPQNGQYILSYEDVNDVTKELTAQTLDDLLAAMRKADGFEQKDFATVRDKAKQIPAVVYADWKAKGVAGGADAMQLLIDALTDFYLNPSQKTYEDVRGIYARMEVLATLGDEFMAFASIAYMSAIGDLNPAIRAKVENEATAQTILALAKASDPKYAVFSTRYKAGN
jgi:hypothetical protein